MCGIIGYTGHPDALTVLLRGLEQLEYRGYDSAGIAMLSGEGEDRLLIKKAGPVATLKDACEELEVRSHCGIGHTRWATHGGVNDTNAHPHIAGKVTLIHNGIIENYHNLIEKFGFRGSLVSETDTEVAARLLDYYYHGDPYEAIRKTIREITGSYAFCIMFEDIHDKIFCVRNVSPMVAAHMEDGSFVASDVTALIPYTKRYFVIPEYQIVTLAGDSVSVQDLKGDPVTPEMLEVNWNVEAAQKNGFPHFMLKEIHEQPKAVLDTLNSVIHDGEIDLSGVGLSDEDIRKISRIYIVACGSAYHVGIALQYVIEDMAGIPVSVELASEFRYRKPILDPEGLVIVISQSGETADSIAALREAKDRGILTLGIVNVVGSSIAREADKVFYTLAGPEIAVATTKAYSAQLIAGYLLAVRFAMARDKITEETYREMIAELLTLPGKIEKVLDDKERIQWFASKYSNARDIFFVGRGIDYAISMEGSLKMKEISYVHSEAYAAGELKHGTISLIEDGTLVIGVLTQQNLYEKMISNLLEVKSRGAYLMGLTTYGNYSVEDTTDFTVYIPWTNPYFTTSLAIIPLQLMGYYVSVSKGLDVDKPRNLAKSVTVE